MPVDIFIYIVFSFVIISSIFRLAAGGTKWHSHPPVLQSSVFRFQLLLVLRYDPHAFLVL